MTNRPVQGFDDVVVAPVQPIETVEANTTPPAADQPPTLSIATIRSQLPEPFNKEVREYYKAVELRALHEHECVTQRVRSVLQNVTALERKDVTQIFEAYSDEEYAREFGKKYRLLDDEAIVTLHILQAMRRVV